MSSTREEQYGNEVGLVKRSIHCQRSIRCRCGRDDFKFADRSASVMGCAAKAT